jgi:pre-rRNA-processing protein TSR1
VPRSSPKAAPTSNAAAQSRLNRRNNAKQGQTTKRQALVSATRVFNGVDGAPRIVAVIPLSEDVNARSTVSALSEALDTPADDCPEAGLWKLKFVVSLNGFLNS